MLYPNLKQQFTSYEAMVEHCTEGNYLYRGFDTSALMHSDLTVELYCGSEYSYYDSNWNEITQDEYYKNEAANHTEQIDFYEYVAITKLGAEHFATFTNETVYYIADYDMYLLAIPHLGISWSMLSSNWK